MTMYEKLLATYGYGNDCGNDFANWDNVRNSYCMNHSNTVVSEYFNEIVAKGLGIKYYNDDTFKPIFEIVVELVYNALLEYSYYYKDTMFTSDEKCIDGMCYLLESVVNNRLGDLRNSDENNNINGYMLGYRPLYTAYYKLFKVKCAE